MQKECKHCNWDTIEGTNGILLIHERGCPTKLRENRMQFLIPYKRYYISYEIDTHEYLVLSSTSESDFEYVQVDVCQSLGEAVKSVDKRMKG